MIFKRQPTVKTWLIQAAILAVVLTHAAWQFSWPDPGIWAFGYVGWFTLLFVILEWMLPLVLALSIRSAAVAATAGLLCRILLRAARWCWPPDGSVDLLREPRISKSLPWALLFSLFSPCGGLIKNFNATEGMCVAAFTAATFVLAISSPVKEAYRDLPGFRFRLRTLLIAVTVLTVPMAWVGYSLSWIAERRAARESGLDMYPFENPVSAPFSLRLFGEPGVE